MPTPPVIDPQHELIWTASSLHPARLFGSRLVEASSLTCNGLWTWKAEPDQIVGLDVIFTKQISPEGE
jgi:hypothetical protein